MTFTHGIGVACGSIIRWIVRGLALSRIHPNVLTFLGLVISSWAGFLMARGQFWAAGWVIVGGGLVDMVAGRVARETNRVTRFGGFFDSVLDRYSDLAVFAGLILWYGGINRPGYVVLSIFAMMACVMISYARARAENTIPTCKVGFLERPERVVLIIIGALFDRMAPVLWVTAVLGTITVIHRMVFTFQEAKRLEDAQLRPTARAASPTLRS